MYVNNTTDNQFSLTIATDMVKNLDVDDCTKKKETKFKKI
jgi:hypothetical protein